MSGARLQGGQRPTAVVAGEVEETCPGEHVGVLGEDGLVAQVQPVPDRSRPARLEEAGIVVEEARGRRGVVRPTGTAGGAG
jgi:hypothetical protein